MKFLSDVLAKAGLIVDGVVTLNNTATGQTPDANDNSTKLATTAWVRTFVQPYSLPIASASVLGGIKVGTGLSINSTTGVLSVTGAGAASIKSTQTFVVTEGQTVFTVTGGYTPGLMDVFVNGVYLSPNQITATNGTTFTINDPAVTGDIVDVIVVSAIYEGATTTTDQLPEGVVNLYYTNARARAAISLTVSGTSGASTYDSATGVLNVPTYTLAGLGGVVSTRTITINGVTYDLTANRSWSALPVGGTAGQLLAKVDGTDYNAQWINEAPAASYTSQLKHVVKAGAAINKGQAVYVSSSDGTNMIVNKASNASEQTSSKTLGLLETTVSNNGFTNVITEGLLAGLDTTGANAAGDPVWLGTDGNLIYGLVNKPSAPAHLVFIGVVTRRNANNGEIFVKVQNGFEMKELHDYVENGVQNNFVISYESSTSLYKPKSIATLLGYTPANAARSLTINGTSYDLTADRTWILTTSNIAEGTNLYYTDTRVGTYLTANSYATQSYVSTQINNLVSGAPGLLDTLDELAAALGDDPNFATTVSTALGNRLRVDINNQGLTSTQQGNGRTNLGLGSLAVLSSVGNAQITDLAYSKLTGVPSTFAPSAHTHPISDITGLQTALDGKQASLSGTGFVKISGSTISYDNSTYYLASNPNNYISSYTETDTLASVTGRGATTTSEISFNAVATVNGSGDWTNATTYTYKINPSSSYWRIAHLSAHSTVSGVYTYQTGKSVYWGEDTDTGDYSFRGRTLKSGSNTVWHAGNLTNLNQLSNGPGYITGYTETDTLASVTGRGASTSTDITLNGTLTMGTGGTSYVRMGRYPASVTNTGEAWIGRASDRNTGTMTIQLGGNSASSRTFEVVDYAWSVVLFQAASDGNSYASSSFRAPIFYDTNNTGYYLDPASTSALAAVDMYSTSTLRQGSELRFYTSAGNLRGYIQATDTDDNHLIIATSGGEDIVFRDGGVSGTRNLVIRGSNVGTEIYGSTRSPIFYDSNDTGFYFDGASTSVLNALNVNSILVNNSVRIQTFNDRNLIVKSTGNTDAGILGRGNGDQFAFQLYGSSPDYGFLSSAWGSWDLRKNNGGPIYLNNQSTYYYDDDVAYVYRVYGTADMRSPIYYDLDNTAYYLDPASTSNIGNLQTNTGPAMSGGWNRSLLLQATYPVVVFNSNGSKYSGIGVDFSSTTSGFVFWVNGSNADISGSGTAAMNIHTGNFVSAAGSFRAPIFYDSDNTGYYLSPDSTSVLANVQAIKTYQTERFLDVPGSNDGSYRWVRFPMGWFNSGGMSAEIAISRSINDNGNSPYGGCTARFIINSREWHSGQDNMWYFYTEHGSNNAANGLYGYYIYQAGPRDLAGGGYWFYMRLLSGVRYRMSVSANMNFNSNQMGGPEYDVSDPGGIERITLGTGVIGNNGNYNRVYSQYGFYSSDVRTPVYYDSNDTNYYIDPNGNTVLTNATFNVNGSSTLSIIAGGTNATVIRAAAGDELYIGGNNSWQMRFSGANVLMDNGGYLQNNESIRTPIYYDSQDTFYFVDANSTSRLSTVTAYGEYGSYRNDTQSLLRSYNTSAGSPLQFYLDHNYGNVNIGNNRGIVYAGGTYWEFANSARAPIFYDSNNTGFYVDPNSNSNLAALQVQTGVATNSFYATGAGGQITITAATGSFGGYLRTSGHMVLDQSNTGYNVYVLDGNSVGVVKNASSQSWSAFSDRTIKTVHSVMVDNLSKLESITPIYYSFNNFADDKNRIGLIAQEVQEQFPELVELEPRTEKLTLDYTGLIPVLLGAIKELKSEVEILKTQL